MANSHHSRPVTRGEDIENQNIRSNTVQAPGCHPDYPEDSLHRAFTAPHPPGPGNKPARSRTSCSQHRTKNNKTKQGSKTQRGMGVKEYADMFAPQRWWEQKRKPSSRKWKRYVKTQASRVFTEAATPGARGAVHAVGKTLAMYMSTTPDDTVLDGPFCTNFRRQCKTWLHLKDKHSQAKIRSMKLADQMDLMAEIPLHQLNKLCPKVRNDTTTPDPFPFYSSVAAAQKPPKLKPYQKSDYSDHRFKPFVPPPEQEQDNSKLIRVQRKRERQASRALAREQQLAKWAEEDKQKMLAKQMRQFHEMARREPVNFAESSTVDCFMSGRMGGAHDVARVVRSRREEVARLAGLHRAGHYGPGRSKEVENL
eukprot:CAMPEP_0175155994 /NCGR_PEP_ID=MMETSP0087-20121206/21323_1 /TAXON_ID=136419 /ORGANISM="Unknown Unknown, Strain D1" /LENGTH=366 /DNA_ID=CAMNT_0016443289 /DNA_START=344 /DNA_END=1440 /DNA_ORIENTATION=-